MAEFIFTPEDIQIEEANENDADLIAIMVYDLLGEIYGDNLAVSDVEVHESAIALLQEGGKTYRALIALDPNRKPLGIMTLTEGMALFSRGKFGIITEFFVDPKMRSKGVGERIFEHALNIARESSWSSIEVSSLGAQMSKRGTSFYLRNGFVELGSALSLNLSS